MGKGRERRKRAGKERVVEVGRGRRKERGG